MLQLIFALGGGLGAVSRHFLSKLIPHRYPVSTLIVNIVGSLILGIATGLLIDNTDLMPQPWHQLVFGFTGGFTTFSSFAYQSLDLHRQHSVIHAAINVLSSLLLCLAAFAIGIAVFSST